MKSFAAFESRTIVRATLVMDTALSVGARLSAEPVGTDAPVMRDGHDRPFVPGSSIKGLLRAEAEGWLRALPATAGLRACDPLGKPCVPRQTRDELAREAQRDEERLSAALWERSCTICRLFGSPWLASRLLFRDAPLRNADRLPVVTQIRDGVGIDRDLGAARSGIKYDFEVVVPGAEFGIEILGENLDDWEVGLLVALLRVWETGQLALGGKRTRGPGWGRLRDLEVLRAERSELLDYLLDGRLRPLPSTQLDACVAAFRNAATSAGGPHA